MLLSHLIKNIKNQVNLSPINRNGDAEIFSISSDSRQVESNALFICMPSQNTQTHNLIPQVIQKGAKACVVHSHEGFEIAKKNEFPCIWLENKGHLFNQYLGYLCREFYGDLSSKLRIIGITGTNGKTSSCCILRDALEYLEQSTAYIGTFGYQSSSLNKTLANGTPYPIELWETISLAVKSGNKNLVMEVTSEGLDQNRLAGISFDVGVFTNFTQDHLNYHQTMEAYALAKKKFFTEVAKASKKGFKALIGVDDSLGERWAKEFSSTLDHSLKKLVTFGINNGDLRAQLKKATLTSLEILVTYKNDSQICKLNLGGLFNIYNVLTAIGCLLILGYDLKQACNATSYANPVKGRFEPIINDFNIDILVDYAHSADSLINLLESVKSLVKGKIITVIGCGGDRDKTKRPLMARAASLNSDLTILTSDNPRTEDPSIILDDAKRGIVSGKKYEMIIDRREAIARAIEVANCGDAVLIAGKGHEDYQIIGHTKYPFNDRQIAKEILSSSLKAKENIIQNKD